MDVCALYEEKGKTMDKLNFMYSCDTMQAMGRIEQQQNFVHINNKNKKIKNILGSKKYEKINP